MLTRAVVLATSLLAAGCARATYSAGSHAGPCGGARVLEFSNLTPVAVRVGWIPDTQVRSGQPLDLWPIWLGVAQPGVDSFPIPEPGQVHFTLPDSVPLPDPPVQHRVLCIPAT